MWYGGSLSHSHSSPATSILNRINQVSQTSAYFLKIRTDVLPRDVHCVGLSNSMTYETRRFIVVFLDYPIISILNRINPISHTGISLRFILILYPYLCQGLPGGFIHIGLSNTFIKHFTIHLLSLSGI